MHGSLAREPPGRAQLMRLIEPVLSATDPRRACAASEPVTLRWPVHSILTLALDTGS
jgi:hypothetical protein